MSDLNKNIETLRQHVRDYPNFPKPGILFRDLFSIFQQPEVAQIMCDVLVEISKNIEPPVECVAALDARGFLLGPLIALQLKIPFVPIRKKGKLPGKVVSASYALEYGEDTLEMQHGSVKEGQRVLIVDDLLATGGSLGAACKLVGELRGEVAACLVLMELTELEGRKQVPAEVTAVLKY